jgi:iron-sulfur cluster assembly protein
MLQSYGIFLQVLSHTPQRTKRPFRLFRILKLPENWVTLLPVSPLFRFNLNNDSGFDSCGYTKRRGMIKVNDSAREQVSKLISESGNPDTAFVRVGVQGGGCSGLMYELSFDHELREDDKVFEDNGVKVVVDKKSFLYLVGTELEYSGGLNGKGFVFRNPNASRTCGCGESFSI